jgi:hypothetical protein
LSHPSILPTLSALGQFSKTLQTFYKPITNIFRVALLPLIMLRQI